MMKTCLLVNSRSGGWARCREVLESLAAQTNSPIVREGDDCSLDHVLTDVRRAGVQRIIVAGGDGTLARVVNHAIPFLNEIELAVLPVGTGNDFARSVGVPGDSLEAAWEMAVTQSAVPIDLVKITDGETRYMLNAATGGFGGIVTTDLAADDKQRWGAVAYWMKAFSKLVAPDQFRVRLELDADVVSLETYGLAITNGRYVGGGFPVAPMAMVNDGLLDVAVVSLLPSIDLVAVGVEFALGQHEQPDRVTTFQSKRVRVYSEPTLPYSLDGEPAQSVDATFEVVPKAMHFVASRDACGLQL